MTEIQWAITGPHGLYYGTTYRRDLAIAQHVWALDQELFDKGFPHYLVDGLNDNHRKAWAKRKRMGDRAVKVRVEVIS